MQLPRFERGDINTDPFLTERKRILDSVGEGVLMGGDKREEGGGGGVGRGGESVEKGYVCGEVVKGVEEVAGLEGGEEFFGGGLEAEG
jgi:hypothetical protein